MSRAQSAENMYLRFALFYLDDSELSNDSMVLIDNHMLSAHVDLAFSWKYFLKDQRSDDSNLKHVEGETGSNHTHFPNKR